MSTRILIAAGALTACCGLAVAFHFSSSKAARAVEAAASEPEPVAAQVVAPAAGPEVSPIPTRPEDSKGSYNPYQFVLSPDQAIRLYREKIEQNPRDYITCTLLGQTYVRQA